MQTCRANDCEILKINNNLKKISLWYAICTNDVFDRKEWFTEPIREEMPDWHWSEISQQQSKIVMVSCRVRLSQPEKIFSQSIALSNSWWMAIAFLTHCPQIIVLKSNIQHFKQNSKSTINGNFLSGIQRVTPDVFGLY